MTQLIFFEIDAWHSCAHALHSGTPYTVSLPLSEGESKARPHHICVRLLPSEKARCDYVNARAMQTEASAQLRHTSLISIVF